MSALSLLFFFTNEHNVLIFYLFIYLFKLLKHYLQYKVITGATYNDTIYITYITNQCDYLFKLQSNLHTTYKNYATLTSIL